MVVVIVVVAAIMIVVLVLVLVLVSLFAVPMARHGVTALSSRLGKHGLTNGLWQLANPLRRIRKPSDQ